METRGLSTTETLLALSQRKSATGSLSEMQINDTELSAILYPHFMLTTIQNAEQLTAENLDSLLFAYETIRLRQNYPGYVKTSDEYADLNAFITRMSNRHLLSPLLCQKLFGMITSQQKLNQLEKILEKLEPLTEAKINFVLSSDSLHQMLLDTLNVIDKDNQIFPYIAAQLTIEQTHHVAFLLYETDAKNWLPADLLLHALQHYHQINELLKAVLLLKKSGADLSSTDNQTAVKKNLEFAEAIQYLNAMRVIKRSRTRDPGATTQLIALALLKDQSTCDLLIHYRDYQQQFTGSSNMESSAEQIQRDLHNILYVKLANAQTIFKDYQQKITLAAERVNYIEEVLRQHAGHAFRCRY